MEDLANRIAKSMATVSSRRELFKMLGSAALGAGFLLAGGNITVAQAASCGCDPNYQGCHSLNPWCSSCGINFFCPSGCSGPGSSDWWWCPGPGQQAYHCSECDCGSSCCFCGGVTALVC
jgi:hypothetical protein